MPSYTDTTVNDMIFNVLDSATFSSLGTINNNELYLITDDETYKEIQEPYDSGATATNKWVARIQQNANGNILTTLGTLDTSGTWNGTATTATSANKVANKLTIKINDANASTEGTNRYVFDGSAAKNFTLFSGNGIDFTIAAGSTTITNSGVRSIATGSSNGTISVNTNGTTANVAVKGLGSNAYTSTAYLPLAGGTMTGAITFLGNQSSAYNDKGIIFTKGSRIGENSSGAIGIYAPDKIYLRPSSSTGASTDGIIIDNTGVYPGDTNTETLGTSGAKWSNVYATTFNGAMVGKLTIGNKQYNGSSDITVDIADLGLAQTTNFLGVTTSTIVDGQNTSPITLINNTQVTPVHGDIVMTQSTGDEFVYMIANGVGAWHHLGIASSYALQNHGHGNITHDGNLGINSVAVVTDSTGYITTESLAVSSMTATTSGTNVFVSSVSQSAIGKISVTTNTLATASGTTLGGIKIGFETNATNRNYAVQLSSEKAYVNVPWTDTKNTAGSTDTTSKIFLIGATSQAANPQTYSDSEVYVESGTLYLVKTQDLSGTANNKPALVLGGAATSTHMEFDCNEIQAKTNGTSTAALYLNNDGGLVTVGSGGLVVNSLTASQAVSTDANKKLVSTNLAVSDPTASGSGLTYIATISQSSVGKISVTKSTVQDGTTSQKGVVQLTNSTSSTSTTTAATPSSVKSAYDLANTANTTANAHKFWADLEATSAATYNKAPEMATIKLNGNTSASAASTKNVTLQYDSTLETLNFVFT